MSKMLSRRDFLKGAAAGTVGIAAMSLTGCGSLSSSAETTPVPSGAANPGDSSQNQAVPSDLTPDTTMDCDIAVVGGGASGLAAALEASEAGADVIIMDNKSFGGNLACSEGAFAVQSHWQKELGYDYTVEDAFKEIVEYHHYRNNIRFVREFVNRSADMIQWVEDHGVQISGVGTTCMAIPNGTAGKKYLDKYFWHMWSSQGAAAPVMRDAVEKAGATMLAETSGLQLIMSGGECAGVFAKNEDQGIIRINAKAVIIATGGFSENTDMVNRYTCAGEAEKMIYPGMPGHNGDGINMAWDVGAARGVTGLFSLGTFEAPSLYPKSWCQHMNVISFQPYLWVNKNGLRYCSETYLVPLQCHGAVLLNQPDQVQYTVFDQKMMDTMTKDKLINGLRNWPHDTSPLSTLPDDLETAKTYNLAISADTVDELADKASEAFGMDAEQFKGTLSEYNDACKNGRDEIFGKDAKWLQAIETNPFYMVQNTNGYLGTLGGIKINEKCEALSAADDKKIPGLYAAGMDASTIFGEFYDFSVSGEATASALVSGRMAGEFAAKYVKQ